MNKCVRCKRRRAVTSWKLDNENPPLCRMCERAILKLVRDFIAIGEIEYPRKERVQ